MELFTTMESVIIQNKSKNTNLWCNKADARLIPVEGCNLPAAWNPVCRGVVHGVIGKMQLYPGSNWKLLVISQRDFVGYLPFGVEVYRIRKIGVVSLSTDAIDISELNLSSCPVHGGEDCNEKSTQQKVQEKWHHIKNKANDGDKVERRLFEELLKMFNETGAFYYSPNGDLSNSYQRRSKFDEEYHWQQTDERFFWNKFMLSDLIDLADGAASLWVLPVIQGFIQMKRCYIDHLECLNMSTDSTDGCSDDEDEGYDMMDCSSCTQHRSAEGLKEDEYDLIVLSRRGRHRAGTRYNRRGVDENGDVANYVETEVMVCVLTHIISFVQLRGSVPVYWSQPGVKYKPLPVIDRDFAETKEAFAKHFDKDLLIYNKEILVNLIESNGREKTVGDAFFDHIYEYNSKNLTYIVFDFHEYCRGMKFENVAVLVNVLEHFLDQMGFYWTDQSGTILEQSSIFRVNCMDCLDRTNVVQAAIGKCVLNMILRKLGRLLPEEVLPKSCHTIHNHIWASNGDAISRQYAGTAAMKGDFTRTGERKIAGVMKDGYNSASRYYLNRYKDNYRQTVIDMMLGNPIAEDLAELKVPTKSNMDEEWTSDKEESITQLVRHTQLVLLQPNEHCFGGWALVDPYTFNTSLDTPQDEDIILLLAEDAYYVARYNDEIENINSYQKIPLKSLEKIEIGQESFSVKTTSISMRIYHQFGNSTGFFHSMRTIQHRTYEEARSILLSIAGTFFTVCRSKGLYLKVTESKLDKKCSKPHRHVKTLSSERTLRTYSKSEKELKNISGGSSFNIPPNLMSDNDFTLNLQSSPLKQSHSLSDISNQSTESNIPKINICDVDNNLEYPYESKETKLDFEGAEPSGGQKGRLRSSSSDSMLCKLSESNEGKMPGRMNTLFRKTRTAISNIRPQIQKMSPTTKEINFRFSMSPVKNTFRKVNDTLSNSSVGDFKNPLKMLPDFRNRIQNVLISPKAKRRVRIISEEEKERRMNCRTKIIEL